MILAFVFVFVTQLTGSIFCTQTVTDDAGLDASGIRLQLLYLLI